MGLDYYITTEFSAVNVFLISLWLFHIFRRHHHSYTVCPLWGLDALPVCTNFYPQRSFELSRLPWMGVLDIPQRE